MRTLVCREFVWRSYITQRPCLLVAIRRVEFVDRKKFAAVALDKAFSPITLPSFENSCLGPVGRLVSVPEFTVAAVVQECLGDTSHCLEELMPMQKLAPMQGLLRNFANIPLLIYGRAFSMFSSQPMELINRNRANLLPRHRVTGLVRPPGLPVSQACPPFETRPTTGSSNSPQVSC